jgi:hypothetical protein
MEHGVFTYESRKHQTSEQHRHPHRNDDLKYDEEMFIKRRFLK